MFYSNNIVNNVDQNYCLVVVYQHLDHRDLSLVRIYEDRYVEDFYLVSEV